MAQDAAVAPWAGRYEIERLLGEGERKQVYLARDLIVDREVALALIDAEEPLEGGLTLTQWEAKVNAQLGAHPHVVTIFDLGEHEGQTYTVSQYMRGGDLLGRVRRANSEGSTLRLGNALRYATEICDALAYAHSRGIVHRDVQPANIWLDEPEGRAHIGDFDLALAPGAPSRLRDPALLVTTCAYVPPEEVLGQPVDARADLYSLGATVYELLVGRPPFEGTPSEVVNQHLRESPRAVRTLRDDVPRPLDELILRLLEKSPDDRPGSAGEALDALRAIGSTVSAHAMDITEMLADGESSRVEFKETFRYDVRQDGFNPNLQKAVTKSIAGFMNAEGGTLLIGIDDDGRVQGIERDFRTLSSRPNRDGWELDLTQTMMNHLGPDAAAAVSVHFAELDGGTVAAVRCRARAVPTWVDHGGQRRFFTRVGNSTRPLPDPFARAYIEQNWPR